MMIELKVVMLVNGIKMALNWKIDINQLLREPHVEDSILFHPCPVMRADEAQKIKAGA